jgi:hypothetical protein
MSKASKGKKSSKAKEEDDIHERPTRYVPVYHGNGTQKEVSKEEAPVVTKPVAPAVPEPPGSAVRAVKGWAQRRADAAKQNSGTIP